MLKGMFLKLEYVSLISSVLGSEDRETLFENSWRTEPNRERWRTWKEYYNKQYYFWEEIRRRNAWFSNVNQVRLRFFLAK